MGGYSFYQQHPRETSVHSLSINNTPAQTEWTELENYIWLTIFHLDTNILLLTDGGQYLQTGNGGLRATVLYLLLRDHI